MSIEITHPAQLADLVKDGVVSIGEARDLLGLNPSEYENGYPVYGGEVPPQRISATNVYVQGADGQLTLNVREHLEQIYDMLRRLSRSK